MGFFQIVVVAILVEAIWDNCKMVWQKGKVSIDRIGALFFGILVCVLTNVDIFPMVGLTITIPVIGSALTGIIASRGANFVHDLAEKINSYKTSE